MRSAYTHLFVVALLVGTVSLAFTPTPVQADHKDRGWEKAAAGFVVGLIVGAALDDDHHHHYYGPRQAYYFRCPYCGYYGPYRGPKWVVRYHSHGHRVLVRTGRYGTRFIYSERPRPFYGAGVSVRYRDW
jgi:hypothetical protein